MFMWPFGPPQLLGSVSGSEVLKPRGQAAMGTARPGLLELLIECSPNAAPTPKTVEPMQTERIHHGPDAARHPLLNPEEERLKLNAAHARHVFGAKDRREQLRALEAGPIPCEDPS